MRWRMFVSALLLAVCSLPLLAGKKPNQDKLANQPRKEFRNLTPDEKVLVKAGARVQLEERLGVPTFVWAAPGASRRQSPFVRNPEAEARGHFARFASLYGLGGLDLASLVTAHKHDTGKGVVLVSFKPQVGDIDVFREEVTIAMDQNLSLVAVTGYALGGEQGHNPAVEFTLTERDAVAAALSDLRGETITVDQLQLNGAMEGKFVAVDTTSSVRNANPDVLLEPARVKQVYFRLPDQLVPAYYVEVNTSTTPAVDSEGLVNDITSDMYSYVISATTGEILFRNDLGASDSFTYRVWADTTGIHQPLPDPSGSSGYPHPTGLPDFFQAPFVPTSLVTLQNGPISTNDPWLAPGATETNGNNADAYVDLVTPDGFTPPTDFRANMTSPGAFDRTYDVTLQPNVNQEQQKASITQLFYMNNWLHDWYYDAGFDEASGNAQDNNYGRGGIGGDRIRAEAQDFSGLNNANMNTPSDGGRPRMQMFIFTGPSGSIVVNSQPSPATLPSLFALVGTASFGLQLFEIPGDVRRAVPNDACDLSAMGDLTGKIALIDRGGVAPGGAACGFALKTQNAKAKGAIGVIIANVSTSVNPSIPPNMGGTAGICVLPGSCDVGVLSLNFSDGQLLRAAVAAGTVNVNLSRPVALNRDGTIDNMIIAHEWGHYISNRLVHNSAGLVNNQGRGMGEGWGDFHALLLTVRAEDAAVPSNPNWNGVFAMGGYTTLAIAARNNYYFGIRRLPYSSDFTKNALTFKHIQNGVPLPTGIPIFPNSSVNSEVHNTGEIWASMLWEAYSSLLRDTLGSSPRLTFDEARDRMKRYLVAGYKMTPVAPTFTEARDAVLAAAYANDVADGHVMCEAFARRGAGTFAASPDRFSTTNIGVTESFVCGDNMLFDSASFAVVAQCDSDPYLDNSETGRLTVSFKNIGGNTLTGTTATITSSNPTVTFPNGNVINYGPVTPFTIGTGSVDVGMFGAVGIQTATFTITISNPAVAVSPTASFEIAGNINEVPASSATDDVESESTVWTVAGDNTLNTASPWRRIALAALDHRWFAPNAGAPSDQYLISPALHVGSGNFSFTFTHRYSFESPLFDGGVIEISTNNGATWSDVGAANISPSYNGTLVASGTNPLRGRQAFVNNSSGYPNFINATVNLGTAYAGQDVKIRFRTGADDNTAAVGWDVDNIAFSGITNTPFATLVAQSGSCAAGRLLVTQVESLGAPNPTVNEWIELRNVSAAPLDLIGIRICDDQALASPSQCDTITTHQVLDGGKGVVFAADKNVFMAMHPSYTGRVLDDPSDSYLGANGLDNDGDGVHLFEPYTPGSIDCMNYHNSNICFAGVVKDDGATTMQRSITDPSPKLRSAWTRGPEILP